MRLKTTSRNMQLAHNLATITSQELSLMRKAHMQMMMNIMRQGLPLMSIHTNILISTNMRPIKLREHQRLVLSEIVKVESKSMQSIKSYTLRLKAMLPKLIMITPTKSIRLSMF